jgi:hypothetical protein
MNKNFNFYVLDLDLIFILIIIIYYIKINININELFINQYYLNKYSHLHNINYINKLFKLH